MAFKDTVRAIRKKRKKKTSYGDHSMGTVSGDTPGNEQGGNPGGN